MRHVKRSDIRKIRALMAKSSNKGLNELATGRIRVMGTRHKSIFRVAPVRLTRDVNSYFYVDTLTSAIASDVDKLISERARAVFRVASRPERRPAQQQQMPPRLVIDSTMDIQDIVESDIQGEKLLDAPLVRSVSSEKHWKTIVAEVKECADSSELQAALEVEKEGKDRNAVKNAIKKRLADLYIDG